MQDRVHDGKVNSFCSLECSDYESTKRGLDDGKAFVEEEKTAHSQLVSVELWRHIIHNQALPTVGFLSRV